MRVKITRLSIRGQQIQKSAPERGVNQAGDLKVFQEYSKRVNRLAVQAHLIDQVDGVEGIRAELIDPVLVWVEGKTMRLRGIEIERGIEYGQTWEIEIL